jgi:hypothetical protein
MDIAVNLALGLADLPAVQGFQDLREEPVASPGNAAEPSGNATRATPRGAAGHPPLGEAAKEAS